MIDTETLILYYYDDGLSARERERVGAALRSDSALAQRYRALQLELGAMKPGPAAAAPRAAVARWHRALDDAADAEMRSVRRRPNRTSFLPWYASAAVALVVGIGIGIQLGGERPAVTPVVQVTHAVKETRLPGPLARGLTAHLQDTQLRLASFTDASAAEREALVRQILDQNRAFARAAERSGAPDLARLLRAFELRLQAMAGDDASEDTRAARDQLVFELGVTLTKLSQPSSEAAYEL